MIGIYITTAFLIRFFHVVFLFVVELLLKRNRNTGTSWWIFSNKEILSRWSCQFLQNNGEGHLLTQSSVSKESKFFSQPQELLEIALSIIKGKQAILQDIVSYTIWPSMINVVFCVVKDIIRTNGNENIKTCDVLSIWQNIMYQSKQILCYRISLILNRLGDG